MFHITEVDKNHSALSGLVSELDAFQSQLYSAESNHCLDFFTVTKKVSAALLPMMQPV